MAANRFELLATWYLRFNGYFTTPDFTVHPDFKKQGGGTDADILAVRFPYSAEYQRRFNFDRDDRLENGGRVDFVIAEVKTGRCEVNQKTWGNPARCNVEYALRWMGFEREDARIREIAETIYSQGQWNSEDKSVRFLLFGGELNEPLTHALPGALQLEHSSIIRFLKVRFELGCVQITRENWDREIQDFAELSRNSSIEQLYAWAKDDPLKQMHSEDPTSPL